MRIVRNIAVLNFVPVLVLGAGGYALPARYWPVDVLLGATLALLLLASVAALLRARFAIRALQIALWALFGVGALLVSGFAFSLAFLSGIHNAFGVMGAILMTLVLLLLLPYTLLYPVSALWWLRRATSGGCAHVPSPAAATPGAGVPASSAPGDPP